MAFTDSEIIVHSSFNIFLPFGGGGGGGGVYLLFGK